MAALTTTLFTLLHSPSHSRSPAIASFPSSSPHSLSFINSSSSSFISSNFSTHLSLVATRSSKPSVSFYTKASAAVEKKKVLIVNTNSGAHVIIGFYFAKQLLGAGHDVTFFIVGEEGSDKMKKTPFTRLSELTSVGGKTVWGEPADIAKVIGNDKFDVVLENNAKDLETFKPVADWAKSTGVSQFLYISSAGIYIPTDEVPHVEGDAVKSDAGHIFAENYLAGLSFPTWSVFRPQYITGSGNNKDCEEWFFDRIVRNRPVPIPGSGLTLTNIAHVKDLSNMLSLAIEKPDAASGKLFNCVSDRAVTLNGFAKLCAQAAGREVKIVNYNPKALGLDPKKAFPFRIMHFYAEPRAAKEILGWSGETNLPEDLKERFDEYVKLGRDAKSVKFDIDDKILESLKVPVSV